MNALGQDLEGKGYRFTEKSSPWLGQIACTGRDGGKQPSTILTLRKFENHLNDEPHRLGCQSSTIKDRLDIYEEVLKKRADL